MRHFRHAGRSSLLLALCSLAACADQAPADAPSAVDYHRDAVAVLDRYCTSCHSAGGIGPLVLTDYESARRYSGAIKDAVQAERMPPWMPSEQGLPLRYSRKMRPEDRDLLLRWIDSGTPEGDPQAVPRRDIPPAETVAMPRADIVADPGRTYQPDNSRSDDYHCFVFDPQLGADTFLQAATVVPGNRAIVHHVLMFEILESDAAEIRRLNASGDGYKCFGGPGGTGRPTTLFGWAPGGVPVRVRCPGPGQGPRVPLCAGCACPALIARSLILFVPFSVETHGARRAEDRGGPAPHGRLLALRGRPGAARSCARGHHGVARTRLPGGLHAAGIGAQRFLRLPWPQGG